MAALEAPPTLLTMEGEPAVFCPAEYAINDPDQAAAALHDRFEPDPDGRIFIDWVEVDGQRWGRGTLEVYATRLRIQTNGEARLDRFKAVVEEVIEGAELLDETRRPVAEQLAEHRRSRAATSDEDTDGDADADVTGLLVPVRDPAALEAAISALVSDPARRSRMAAASRDKAIAEFDDRRQVAITLDVYEQLRGESRTSSTVGKFMQRRGCP